VRTLYGQQAMYKLVTTGIAVAAAVGVATAAATSYSSPVPLKAQQQIKQRTSLYAYVPARAPAGFRYTQWSYTTKPEPVVREWFSNKAHQSWEITFVVSSQKGKCPGSGPEKTFQVDGNKVYWVHTHNDQRAWRCVTGKGNKIVRLEAANAIPATQFAASGLAQVAASGVRIK
jgi:hypothetical protein